MTNHPEAPQDVYPGATGQAPGLQKWIACHLSCLTAEPDQRANGSLRAPNKESQQEPCWLSLCPYLSQRKEEISFQLPKRRNQIYDFLKTILLTGTHENPAPRREPLHFSNMWLGYKGSEYHSDFPQNLHNRTPL